MSFESNDGFNPNSAGAPQISGVTRAFIELEKIKPEYQQLIGQVMLKIADGVKKKRKLDAQKNLQNKGLRELGADKVVGLMKSQSRRRWYDQDRVLHKVYQDLFILEQVGRPFLSEGMLRAIQYVNKYVSECDESERLEDLEDVVKLIELALYGEPEAADEFLDTVFHPDDSMPDDRSVGAQDAGMRIERSK